MPVSHEYAVIVAEWIMAIHEVDDLDEDRVKLQGRRFWRLVQPLAK